MSFANNGMDIMISTPLRTAVGTFGGTLKEVSATDLGATVAKEVALGDADIILAGGAVSFDEGPLRLSEGVAGCRDPGPYGL